MNIVALNGRLVKDVEVKSNEKTVKNIVISRLL